MTKILRFACGVAVFAGVFQLAQAAVEPARFHVTTLSSRPDMVSGGDVLVQVDLPSNVTSDKIVVRLNGQDISSSLHAAPAGHAMLGIVSGLHIGENKLEVFDGSGTKPVAEAELRDYPITGPIFSGSQEHPFLCQTQKFTMPDGRTLGAPLDDNCSVKTVVSYVYKSTQPAPAALGGRGDPAPINFKPLTNMASLPADLDYTITTSGQKVPFVVRIETGTINRGIYQFAVLSDPTKERDPGPLNPPKSWNKRLLYSFGGGCPGGELMQGTDLGFDGTGPVPTEILAMYGVQQRVHHGILYENVVGKGYAEASSSLNVAGNNCNPVLAAETMMMVKERFVKAYGLPDFTFGRGGSGGAEQQIPIADEYPGLLDGIIPSATFPDVLTNLQNHYDTALVDVYFEKSGNSLTDEQKLAILGTGKMRDASWDISRIDPTRNCPAQLPQPERYDPAKNRTGARCDLFDHNVNLFGRDPATGFARRTNDNTGVQYGLAALNGGEITPAQFLDLNEKIGGYDNDGKWMTSRNVGDPVALRRAYEKDVLLNGGMGLGKLPIIDVRSYGDLRPKGDAHQKYHSFALRDRLLRANGTFENDVLLVSSSDHSNQVEDYAIAKMDEWLTNLKKDTSDAPIAQKVLHAKPADLVDACWDPKGRRIVEPQTFAGGKCNEIYPTHSSPRMIAGSPVSNDSLKCQLKPINFGDYKVTFTNAEKARLTELFHSGVCDWSKPGVEQQLRPTETWASY